VAMTAVTELTDHIESIRQEAYNEGYAAAMRAVVEFSTSGTVKPKVTAIKATATKAAVATRASATKATTTKAIAAKSTTSTTAAARPQRRAQAKPAARQIRRWAWSATSPWRGIGCR
jgi:hypothetical protein